MPPILRSPRGLWLAEKKRLPKNTANFFLFFFRFCLHFFSKRAYYNLCACAQEVVMRYGFISRHLRFGLPLLVVLGVVVRLLGLA